jgi:hypothetical protein
VERALLAVVCAAAALAAEVFAVESAKAALPAAVVAVSYATLTALGVAASVVEVLEVLVFS